MKPAALALLIALSAVPASAAAAESPAGGQPQAAPAAPAAPAPAPPATGAAPPAAAPSPPPYGYPPYGYPPYGYPPASPPGYAYPGYPAPYPAPYPPGYPPPAPAAPPPPDVPPSGKWRAGGSLLLVKPNLVYNLKYRGEPLDYNDRGVEPTLGVAGIVEYDVISHLFVGFALQFLPKLRWDPVTTTDPITGQRVTLYGGTAREYDFLPQVGGYWNATPRLRLLAVVAGGYSLLETSSLQTLLPVDHGLTHGFVLQAGGGILYAIGTWGFFSLRGLYQRSTHKQQVKSPTTGQTAEPTFFLSFFALQGAFGAWF